MNAIGTALLWCAVQVTLIGLMAAGLYLLVRRLRPAAAAPVVLTSMVMVVLLSVLAISPWPRWKLPSFPLPPGGELSASPLPPGEGPGVRENHQPPQQFGMTDDETATDEAAATSDVDTNLSGTVAEDDAQPAVRPSLASLLWQTLAEAMSDARPAGSAEGQKWPAVVAATLLVAMTLGLAWLLLGVAAVRWQRIRSQPLLDRELLELVDVLRAELGCTRPVELRQSDDLATAATIGWRRPAVLLPADWRDWTPDQCRAILAHEIAHARSHDFLALLFGQLGLVLHFYHPLLHWLMNRLRLEQELAADAAAASISGGQRQYLTTIAELALRQQGRPMSWPARTFLPTQSTFLRRIAMLRDSKLRVDRLSPITRAATVGVVLLCGLLVAGLRGPSGAQQAVAAEPEQSAPTTDAKKPAENFEINGAPAGLGKEPAGSENILANPGAEEGEDFAEDWLQGPEIKGVEYIWDKKVAFEGKASLCIKKTVNSFALPIASWSQTVERTGTLPTVEISAQVKTKKVPKAILDVIFLNEDDGWISHQWVAYIGAKKDRDPPANHEWKKYSGRVKIPEGTAKICVSLEDYGPGTVWFDDIQAKYTNAPADDPEKLLDKKPVDTNNAIIEGVGWKNVRIGMKREALIEALGKSDDNSSDDRLKWAAKHIECTFHKGAKGVSELRFNRGFKGALANGLGLDSPGNKVLTLYGEPEHVIEQDNGAKEYEYSKKGILFWTHQGKITQIVVFQPSGM